jgi:hypothetical protein
MKPLFTIHAGEFLVGEAIERRVPTVNVWVPAKDTGVDLLVSDASNQRAVSLQVKFSRDYLATHMKDEIFYPGARTAHFTRPASSKAAPNSRSSVAFTTSNFLPSAFTAA